MERTEHKAELIPLPWIPANFKDMLEGLGHAKTVEEVKTIGKEMDYTDMNINTRVFLAIAYRDACRRLEQTKPM